MHTGKYIAIDGPEGSGKTTLLKRLEKEYNLTRIFEPGMTEAGKGIRTILLDQSIAMDPWTQLFLFMADRTQTWKSWIEPAVANGGLVVSDRCYLSSIAHQVDGLGLDYAKFEKVWMAAPCLAPNTVIIIDVPVEVSMQRIAGRKKDRFESMDVDYHKRVRDSYLEYADEVVDGTLSADEVYNRVIGIMNIADWRKPERA